MERKLVLCCLALLMLGGFCFAGNTPWPKWVPPITGTHYLLNNPNAQGANGEGDSPLILYLSSDFVAGDLVTGLNVESADFSGGAFPTHKALEMRFTSPFAITPADPDWTPAGLIAGISPPPPINNYPNSWQFPFMAPVAPPIGFNTVAVVQYTPGHNWTAGFGPLVGATNNTTGFSYAWNALAGSCFQLGVDWMFCLYGNKVPPPVVPIITLQNSKYGTDSDTTAMCKPAGLKLVIHLLNNTGMIWGPGNFSLWARGGTVPYSGLGGTGLDVLSALSSGTLPSPLTVAIPPISLGGSVPLTTNLGGLLEYSFSSFTFEAILSGGSPFQVETYMEDAQFCPTGCQDDNTMETSYYVQSPQQWGDGFCKRFTADLMPSGAFTVVAVDWSPGDFVGAGSPLYKAEMRTDGTYGDGVTPDLSPAGLLTTFNPASTPPGTMFRAAALPPYSFPAPPAGNIYVRNLYVPAYFLIATGTDTAGYNHKLLGDTSFSFGTGAPGFPNGPDGEALPFNFYPITLMVRLVTTVPLDGDINGNGSVANVLPSFASAR